MSAASLETFLSSIARGDVVTGTVAAIHNFGVFVELDGEPADFPGTGFVRVPEVSWYHISHVAEVVEVGQRVAGEVLDIDTDRGQVVVSLKALQENPLVRLAERVGEEVSGDVTKLVPFGFFVRIADRIEGLVPATDPPGGQVTSGHGVYEGQQVTVTIAEVDLQRHRVLLAFVALS